MHYYFLQSETFYQTWYTTYGELPTINYGQLLKNSKNPDYAEEKNIATEKFWKELNGYKIIRKCSFPGKVAGYNIFASIQQIIEDTAQSERSVDRLLNDYTEFIDTAAKAPKEKCEDQLVDLMYHLHLMYPQQFRLDCFAFHRRIIHHQPYEGGYVVNYADYAKKKVALSVIDGQLCLTELSGRVKPHQKFITEVERNKRVCWIDPVSHFKYVVSFARKADFHLECKLENASSFVSRQNQTMLLVYNQALKLSNLNALEIYPEGTNLPIPLKFRQQQNVSQGVSRAPLIIWKCFISK